MEAQTSWVRPRSRQCDPIDDPSATTFSACTNTLPLAGVKLLSATDGAAGKHTVQPVDTWAQMEQRLMGTDDEAEHLSPTKPSTSGRQASSCHDAIEDVFVLSDGQGDLVLHSSIHQVCLQLHSTKMCQRYLSLQGTTSNAASAGEAATATKAAHKREEHEQRDFWRLGRRKPSSKRGRHGRL